MFRHCSHCWHRFRPGLESEDLPPRSRARRVIADMVHGVFSDLDAQELWLLFCCRCTETRVVPLRAWQSRNHA